MDNIRQRKNGTQAHTNDKSTDTKTGTTNTRSGDYLLLLMFLGITLPLLGYMIFQHFPCPVDPEAYPIQPMRKFEGALQPNDRLTAMEKLNLNQFRGPESLAFYKGKIYTGVGDGRIMEIDQKTGETRTVVKTLGVPPCGTLADELNCGRPLGLRVKDGYIYVVDAYLGLFKVHIATGSVENLMSTKKPLPDGFPAKFLNDVAVSSDGKIFMTDSSSRWPRYNHPYVGFENRPDGRLLMYDPAINDTKIVLRGLYFANGVELSKNEDYALITEMSRNRITKVYLKGDKAGTTEIFVDNLPGLPDNLRPSSRPGGGYWVAFAVIRNPNVWSMWDLTANHPWIKRIMASVLHKFTIGSMVPKYGMVIELDMEGNIVRSLHDLTGATLPACSEVHDENGVLYFGSYFLPFLGRLDIR